MPRPTVLCLDDDVAVLALVSKTLSSEGYDVRQARSRAEFDLVADHRSFDIFLIEMMLVDGSGLRITQSLRARTDAGIILVSAQSEEADRVIGLELGADDFITKPFSFRELRARVNALHRRIEPLRRLRCRFIDSHAEDSDVRSFDGITMHIKSRRIVDSAGSEIALTTLEFDVLRTFVVQPNHILSRNQIMDQVRGPGWAVYDRVVDGVVSRLRRKLYPVGGGNRRIRTVRGLGYMLALDT